MRINYMTYTDVVNGLSMEVTSKNSILYILGKYITVVTGCDSDLRKIAVEITKQLKGVIYLTDLVRSARIEGKITTEIMANKREYKDLSTLGRTRFTCNNQHIELRYENNKPLLFNQHNEHDFVQETIASYYRDSVDSEKLDEFNKYMKQLYGDDFEMFKRDLERYMYIITGL